MEVETIYKDFRKILHNYVAARVNNPEDVADILQDIFMKIITKFDSVSDFTKLKSWIFTIAKNTIIDHYRKSAGHSETELKENAEIAAPHHTDEANDHGLDRCLSGFIQQLPPEYREIMQESEIAGVRQTELAEKYGMPYPSLKSRIQRGRDRLKGMLTNCCSIELDRHGNILEATRKPQLGPGCESCK